jgi:hypothetical protein
MVADVHDAVAGALPDALDVIRSLGRLGKQLHFHLHDGHPMIPGLPDHFSFLTRLPIPFSYQGRQSLSTMYGPDGLAAIVSAAVEARPAQAAPSRSKSIRLKAGCPSATRQGSFATGGTPPTPSG